MRAETKLTESVRPNKSNIESITKQAASAGMLEQSANGTNSIEEALANQLTDSWARIQRVKNDQRVQGILSDPEFLQKIQSQVDKCDVSVLQRRTPTV